MFFTINSAPLGPQTIVFTMNSAPLRPQAIVFTMNSTLPGPKIDRHGLEWVRHESPRAHIRRGRSYKLSDASGRPPDAI